MAYLKTLSTFGGEYIHDLSMVDNTQMVFMQAAAPLGWTRKTDINDTGLRVINGNSGVQINAGARVFTSVLSSSIGINGIAKDNAATGSISETNNASLSGTMAASIDARSTSVSELPVHVHGYSTNGHYHWLTDQYPDPPPPSSDDDDGCFSPETLVLMSDGSEKPISEIVIGDKVINATRCGINTVLFIEKHINDMGLYSPGKTPPFATPNHPIWINGVLSAPMNDVYDWLGNIKRFPAIIHYDRKGEEVFNLWLDGDGTYVVNGYGTHSILFDGGFLRNSFDQGILTYDEVMMVQKRNGTYGAFMVNHIAGKINIKCLNKFIAKGLIDMESTTSRILYGCFDLIERIHKIFK